MLEAILAKVGLGFVDKLIDRGAGVWEKYLQKEITKEELRAQLLTIATTSAKEIEIEHSKDLVATYQTFWNAADNDKSNLMKRMWAVTLGSQIFVLFWQQWVAPFLYAYGYMDKGWHDGGTGVWSYALVGGLLGLGPVVLRSGPGAGNITERFKAIVGK